MRLRYEVSKAIHIRNCSSATYKRSSHKSAWSGHELIRTNITSSLSRAARHVRFISTGRGKRDTICSTSTMTTTTSRCSAHLEVSP